MLAWLATKGRIPSQTPDWATGGTQFEKLQDFLVELQESGLDIGAADACLADWLRGEDIDFSSYEDGADEDD